jgi:FtsP/CotA-like multicopper oxidase with cupredoxin domain
VTRIQKAIAVAAAVGGLAWASSASAQLPLPFTTPGLNGTLGPATLKNIDPQAANAAFALQNPLGPGGTNYQVNYPYPGQCLADPLNSALFPSLTGKLCPTTTGKSSFDSTTSQRTAGGWAATGRIPFKVLTPIAAASAPVLPATVATPKFVWEVLNPIDYTPDTTTYPGAHYYEIGLHEANGFQGIASAGLFPNPMLTFTLPYLTGRAVPNGMQWTGLVCNIPTGCNCPADINAGINAGVYATCNNAPGDKIPNGAPLFTPIWGVGQINKGGGPVTSTLTTLGLFTPGASSAWGSNAYVATWPSISIRATRGTPVVVKWVNEFPNNHVLCPHPEAADWPCAIDRTFMGVKARMDPALGNNDALVPPEGVNQWGSPGQPDNSWVTHLHGGEIPPGTDGFAEKWFGNLITANHYANVAQNFVQPPFENPSNLALKRPAGSSDIYTYPMVQEEATIWFHDHTLGKTHHNVIAGPAGFFPVKDLAKHGALLPPGWIPPPAVGTTPLPAGSDYTWLDPVTEPRGALGTPMYDLFLAIQDRSFNDDGSINFSNGLGQTIPPVPPVLPNGYSSITNGVNPQVHPVWVPEYFGDHALVNGVLWPRKTVAPGWYRLRIVDGSDSRCYTLGFRVQKPGTLAPAAGTNVKENLPFYVIANDQGYLKNPVLVPATFTMCPGERYELLVNFGSLANGILAGGAADVYMTNSAAAPFPAGFTPQKPGSPYPELNMIMKFVVAPPAPPPPGQPIIPQGVKSCGLGVPAAVTVDPSASWNVATLTPTGNVAITAAGQYTKICMPANPALVTDLNFKDIRPVMPFAAGTIVRQVYMNEKVDSVTLAPLGMQLNGVPFEYKVTETPKLGTREVWQFVNLTVDAHPMHPHLVQHQVVSRQTFNVGKYKAALCGGTTCMPGPAPGGEMQVVPDVGPLLTGNVVLVTAASFEGGFKDVVQVPPGMVTTIVADWAPRWNTSNVGSTAAPGVAGSPANAATPYYYDPVTSGPYVWHCHINSHEDSEMMRTSLVVQ